MLGEQADLPGLGRPQLENETPDGNGPVVAGALEPLAEPATIAVEAQVGVGPTRWRPPGKPRTRRRSVDDVLAEALEPPSIAGIDQLESLHGCIITETTGRPTSNPLQGKSKEVLGGSQIHPRATVRRRGARRLHEPVRWRRHLRGSGRVRTRGIRPGGIRGAIEQRRLLSGASKPAERGR